MESERGSLMWVFEGSKWRGKWEKMEPVEKFALSWRWIVYKMWDNSEKCSSEALRGQDDVCIVQPTLNTHKQKQKTF